MPGSHALLENFKKRGLSCTWPAAPICRSCAGKRNCSAVASYFGEHIYGALDDYQNFSKKMVIESS